MKPLAIDRAGRRPLSERLPSEQTIRERAEFLAREIQEDVLAPEEEIADAIEREIRRFAQRKYLAASPGREE